MSSALLMQYINKRESVLLKHMLLILKRIIINDGHFDPNNPDIIICDEELESALNVKSLHFDDLHKYVSKRFGLDKVVDSSTLPTPPLQIRHLLLPKHVSPYHDIVHSMKFSDSTKVFLQPKFAEFIKRMEGWHRDVTVFTWREVLYLVSCYLFSDKDTEERIFDKRNKSIANLENDPMGEVFGVLTIHGQQLLYYIREHVIPYKLREV